MGNGRQDSSIASLYLTTPAKIVPSQEVYTRIGAFDLLAPPAGKLLQVYLIYVRFYAWNLPFPHRNTGLPNLQEIYVGTLFPRSVHNGPDTHTYCVYIGTENCIFWPFYRFY